MVSTTFRYARAATCSGIVLGLCLLASACASISRRNDAATRLADYFATHREVPPAIASAMDEGHVTVGMDRDQVWAVLGEPVKRTEFSGIEVWLYPGHRLHQDHLWTQGSTLFKLTLIDGRVAVIEPL